MKSAISFNGVSKVAGDLFGKKTILKDASFNIPEGSVCGLVGHNGAGKSTLISLAVGLQEPTTGTVLLHGERPSSVEARRGLGFAHEVPALPPTMTAREVLNLHLQLVGADANEADALLQMVQLPDSVRRISTYSKGMRQRLTLALALAGKPKTVVLDEPMSGLDPVGRALVRDLLLEQKRRGTTVLFSSHVLSDIASVCDRILVVREGSIVLNEEIASSRSVTWCIQFTSQESAAHYRATPGALGQDGHALFVDEATVWSVCAEATTAGHAIRSVAPREVDLEHRILPLLAAHHD